MMMLVLVMAASFSATGILPTEALTANGKAICLTFCSMSVGMNLITLIGCVSLQYHLATWLTKNTGL